MILIKNQVLLFFGTMAIIGLLLANSYLTDSSNEDYYNFCGEQIPSVEYVLGRQQHLSGFSNNTEKSNYRQYRYDSRITSQEVQQYIEYLCTNENFYLSTKTVDQFILGKLQRNGRQIIMTIHIKKNGYYLTLELQ